MSDFIVRQGVPVLVLDEPKLERRELTRDVELNRSAIRYHAFEIKPGHIILVPARSLEMGRVVWPPAEKV